MARDAISRPSLQPLLNTSTLSVQPALPLPGAGAGYIGRPAPAHPPVPGAAPARTARVRAQIAVLSAGIPRVLLGGDPPANWGMTALVGQVFVEEWASSYGSPYLIVPDDDTTAAVLIEDGPEFLAHTPDEAAALMRPLAFIDGVRRGDASLYQQGNDTGLLARGIAGSHGCGAVVIDPGRRSRGSR